MPALTMTALPDTPAKRDQAALQLATWLLCGAVAAFGVSVVKAAETSAAAASVPSSPGALVGWFTTMSGMTPSAWIDRPDGV